MKNLSIKYKVLIILLLMTAAMIVAMSVNMKIGFDKGFFNYRKALDDQFHDSLIQSLESYYQQNKSWDELKFDRTKWQEILNQSSVAMEQSPPPRRPPPRGPRGHRKQGGPERMPEHRFRPLPGNSMKSMRPRMLPPVVLFDAQKNHIIGLPDWQDNGVIYREIIFQGKTVGYLGILKDNEQHQQQDELFATNIQSMLVKLALFMLIVALILAFPIAKYFTTLINKLTNATVEMAKGDYSLRIESDRKDELGLLANNFDLLAQYLQANAKTQKSMMADIAHELRTPISVIIGEIEAMQDGVHPVDNKTLNLLHTQMSSLVNLVNDLHELSESDLGSLKYKMEKIDVVSLLEASYENYKLAFQNKEIKLEITHNESSCEMMGDINRLKQLLNNLLNNSLHYTHAGGQSLLSLSCNKAEVTLSVKDSEPGLNAKQLDKIFDRLYRADKSRNKTSRGLEDSGGTGLGLAICYQIIKAHNGSIKAQQSPLGGIEIIIKLPRKL